MQMIHRLTQRSIAFFLISHALTVTAQHNSSDETTVGIIVEPTFSGFDYHGITPAITIGCSTFQLHAGPRLNFQKMMGHEPRKMQDMVWDFGYRYSFLQHYNLSWFAAVRGEYGSYKYGHDWHYTPSPDQIDLGDTEFNARTSERQFNLNLYLGTGLEVIAVDKLYFTLFAGAGMQTLTGYRDHVNLETGETVSHTSWIVDQQGASWMISAGIGYRL